MCSSSSPKSNSDYGTSSSASSDDETWTRRPGVCPHCKESFKLPCTLPCGHSLCASCISSLLNAPIPSTPRRNKIRMGISVCSYSRVRIQGTESATDGITYRSPRCSVCGEPPSTIAPIPNLELQSLITQMADNSGLNPAFRCPDSDDECSLRDYKILVTGAPRVGKSSLRRVQYGNDLIFTDVLGDQNGCGDIKNTFMIDIIERSMKSIESADGIVLMYSITDRSSFDLIERCRDRILSICGPSIPFILLGSKSDAWKRRQVQSFEGHSLARRFNCPFREISAKLNDNVNDAFVELLRLVEKRRIHKYC